MKGFVSEYIKSCSGYKQAKSIHHKPFGPLQFLPIPGMSWSFIEGLPLLEGHDMVLVVICRLTKMPLFIPTYKTATSIDLAKLFLRHIFSKHGVAQDIISDGLTLCIQLLVLPV